MIKYWGEDEYDLFGFDFEVADERSWGVVWRRGIFLALETLPHNILSKLHHQSGLFASFLKNLHGARYVSNWTLSPMA